MSKQQAILHVLQHAADEAVVEQFLDNQEVLIWVDWREYEEDLISYFNQHLPEADQIHYEMINIDKPRGIDIVLSSSERKLVIPFAEEKTDRDSAIRAMQEMIAPAYQIRWYLESLGNDTLAFVLMQTAQWLELEEQFGKDKVEFYFQPVTNESVMFNLDADDVFAQVEARANSLSS